MHYHQSERFPFEIESILTKEDHLFPQRSKCKVGFGEKEKQLFYHHDLPSVISQLLSSSVSFYQTHCFSLFHSNKQIHHITEMFILPLLHLHKQFQKHHYTQPLVHSHSHSQDLYYEKHIEIMEVNISYLHK